MRGKCISVGRAVVPRTPRPARVQLCPAHRGRARPARAPGGRRGPPPAPSSRARDNPNICRADRSPCGGRRNIEDDDSDDEESAEEVRRRRGDGEEQGERGEIFPKSDGPKHGGQIDNFCRPPTPGTRPDGCPRMPGSGVPRYRPHGRTQNTTTRYIYLVQTMNVSEKEDAEIKDTAFLYRLPTVVPRVWSRPWRRGATKCRAKHSIGNARTGRGVSAGTALRCSVLRRSIDQKPCSCLHLARGEGRARPLRRP